MKGFFNHIGADPAQSETKTASCCEVLSRQHPFSSNQETSPPLGKVEARQEGVNSRVRGIRKETSSINDSYGAQENSNPRYNRRSSDQQKSTRREQTRSPQPDQKNLMITEKRTSPYEQSLYQGVSTTYQKNLQVNRQELKPSLNMINQLF